MSTVNAFVCPLYDTSTEFESLFISEFWLNRVSFLHSINGFLHLPVKTLHSTIHEFLLFFHEVFFDIFLDSFPSSFMIIMLVQVQNLTQSMGKVFCCLYWMQIKQWKERLITSAPVSLLSFPSNCFLILFFSFSTHLMYSDLWPPFKSRSGLSVPFTSASAASPSYIFACTSHPEMASAPIAFLMPPLLQLKVLFSAF